VGSPYNSYLTRSPLLHPQIILLRGGANIAQYRSKKQVLQVENLQQPQKIEEDTGRLIPRLKDTENVMSEQVAGSTA
jgi:hypothetical protein